MELKEKKNYVVCHVWNWRSTHIVALGLGHMGQRAKEKVVLVVRVGLTACVLLASKRK